MALWTRKRMNAGRYSRKCASSLIRRRAFTIEPLEPRLTLDGTMLSFEVDPSTQTYYDRLANEYSSRLGTTITVDRITEILNEAVAARDTLGPMTESETLGALWDAASGRYSTDAVTLSPNSSTPSKVQEIAGVVVDSLLDPVQFVARNFGRAIRHNAVSLAASSAFGPVGIAKAATSVAWDALKFGAAEAIDQISTDLSLSTRTRTMLSEALTIGFEVHDTIDIFDNADTLLRSNSTFQKKYDALLDLGLDATGRAVQFFGDLKELYRTKLRAPDFTHSHFFDAAIIARQERFQLEALAVASLQTNAQTPLSESEKEVLRSLRLHDPAVQQALQLDQPTSQALTGLLGATVTTTFTEFNTFTGALTIRGTDQADIIDVYRDEQNPSIVHFKVNGKSFSYERSRVLSLYVYAEGGDDHVAIRDDIASTIFGGHGNDTLIGGFGDDVVYGQVGDDELQGRDSSDLLDGGEGSDRLWGGSGDDILIDDGVDQLFDRQLRSLASALQGWSGGTPPDNNAPTVGRITATLTGDGQGGSRVALWAFDVAVQGGSLRRFEWFVDRNRDGVGQASELLAIDSSLHGGWNVSLDPDELAPGSHRILGRAVAQNFVSSSWVSTQLTIPIPSSDNRPDLVGLDLEIDPPQGAYGWGQTLDASFYVENIGRGYATGPYHVGLYLSKDAAFDNSDFLLTSARFDSLISAGKAGTTVTFALPSAPPTGLSDGPVYVGLWVDRTNAVPNERSEDNNRGRGQNVDYRAINVVTNLPRTGEPVIGSLSATPSHVTRGAYVNLLASNVVDDGVVNEVVFYLDSNNNGSLDVGDQFVDYGSRLGTTVTARVNTLNWPLGSRLLFARAKDNNGNFSTVKSLSITVDGVGPAQPDAFESNDSRHTAHHLGGMGVHQLEDLSITNGDHDWFTFDVAANTADVVVEASFFQEAAGNVDLYLELLRNDSSQGFSDTSSAGNTFERITRTLGGGRHHVHIAGQGQATNPDYTLTVSIQPVTGAANPGALLASEPIITQGDQVTLWLDSVMGVSAQSIDGVYFYRDADLDGQITIEEHIGTDWGPNPDGANGKFSVQVPTSTWPLGLNSLFATVSLINGPDSPGRSLAVNVVANQPPGISAVSAPRTVIRGESFAVAAHDVVDPENALQSVSFYVDTNLNGVIDASDSLLGAGTLLEGAWRRLIDSAPFSLGTLQILARATDARAAHSSVISTRLEIVWAPNRNPSISEFVAPVEIAQGDTINLAARGVTDPDGDKISEVQFFLDRNANGLVDADDLHLGVATRTGDDWLLSTATTAWAPGAARVLARAQDDREGEAFATAQIVVLEANRPPLVGAIDESSIVAGQRLSFVVPASDENPNQTITYRLTDGAPSGTSINASSGLFQWSPALSHARRAHEITVEVTDDGSPSRTVSTTFVVNVLSPFGTERDDSLTLRASADLATLEIYDANPPRPDRLPVFTWPMSATVPLLIDTLAGNDSIFVELPIGSNGPAGGLLLDLGSGNNDLHIRSGRVALAPNASRTNVLTALVIDAGAALDLASNDLIVKTTVANKAAVFSTLYSRVVSGFAGGTWNGTGVVSSGAKNNRDMTVSLVDNAILRRSEFGGEPVDLNSLLLKYTYYGDIDQNGAVDADDLTVFANNFGRTSGATQVDGDIDFNGTVDADDLTVFANNFGKGAGAPLAAGPPAAGKDEGPATAGRLRTKDETAASKPNSISVVTSLPVESLWAERHEIEHASSRGA